MAKILQAPDTINGRLGVVYAEIDGRQIELMELSNITATVTKNKTDFRTIGTLNTQNKATGWSGTGSATIRYISSRWGKLMERYAHDHVDTYFTINIVNEDPGSSTGRQRVQLLGCNFDSIDIAKIDIEADILTQDIDFTFDDFNILDSFNEI